MGVINNVNINQGKLHSHKDTVSGISVVITQLHSDTDTVCSHWPGVTFLLCKFIIVLLNNKTWFENILQYILFCTKTRNVNNILTNH